MSVDRRLLGKAIRRVREVRGLTQAGLASRAGLRENSVALIERGERGVSIDTLNALAKALNIPAACLTMLGMTKISGLNESASLVRSFQKLIMATLVAHAKLEGKVTGEKATRKKKKRVRKIASKKLEPA